ncbi:hypothetical protein PVAP13_2NG638900 [Panicum virgatum]|uniref:Peroxidase n=1 Tax=Panicum virgatum TaxID=38727 RepID=A0A8T0VS99_PANVG|nr:hypothetical protein PVAP13_2NG638900 [Panicum virgatum]
MAASASFLIIRCFCLVLVVALLASGASAQLSSTFYDTSCPNALSTIRSAVNAAVAQENRMGASLLRLHFHDCFVQGCDASVLLNDTNGGEQNALPNAGSLRGFGVIDNIKAQVEALCPQTVSCADILAVAARDSVVALGGPSWTVPLGRRDSTNSSAALANSDLPPPQFNLSQLITAFGNKNLDPTDLVLTQSDKRSASTSGPTSPSPTSTPPSPRRSGPTAPPQAATPTWRRWTSPRPTPSTTPTTPTCSTRGGSCTPTRSSSTTPAPTALSATSRPTQPPSPPPSPRP